jgi:hypothetical protein
MPTHNFWPTKPQTTQHPQALEEKEQQHVLLCHINSLQLEPGGVFGRPIQHMKPFWYFLTPDDFVIKGVGSTTTRHPIISRVFGHCLCVNDNFVVVYIIVVTLFTNLFRDSYADKSWGTAPGRQVISEINFSLGVVAHRPPGAAVTNVVPSVSFTI